MSNIQKYGEWGADDAAKEKEESESASQGDIIKIKVGKNVFRILPPRHGKKSPFRVIYNHFVELPGMKDQLVFTCPRMEKKQFCPGCAKVDELRATGDPKDYALAGEIMAQRNVYCNVIDRADPEKGVQILRIGKQLHEQLLALREDEEEGGNYTHPVDGFDIIVTRTGTTKNDTKYDMRPARENSALSDDVTVAEAWLESMRDLDSLVRLPSDETVAKLDRRQRDVTPPPRGRQGSAGTGRGRTRSVADDAIDTTGEPVKD